MSFPCYSGIRYDIRLSQSESFSITITALDINGNPLNLSGYTGISNIYPSYGATGMLGSFNVTIPNPISGQVSLEMDATGTAALYPSLAFYDLSLASGAFQSKYLYGKVEIYPTLSSLLN